MLMDTLMRDLCTAINALFLQQTFTNTAPLLFGNLNATGLLVVSLRGLLLVLITLALLVGGLLLVLIALAVGRLLLILIALLVGGLLLVLITLAVVGRLLLILIALLVGGLLLVLIALALLVGGLLLVLITLALLTGGLLVLVAFALVSQLASILVALWLGRRLVFLRLI